MKLLRLVIALLLFTALLNIAQAAEPEETPTPEVAVMEAGTVEAAVEPTPEATEVIVVPVEEVTAAPAPEEPPVTVINNNGFSFTEVFILISGFVLSVFAVLRTFLMPALKANAELAKQAGDLVPETAFDKMIGTNDAALQLAKTLTPGFKGDDIALEKLRAEFIEWKTILHPLIAQLAAQQPAPQTSTPSGWLPTDDDSAVG